MFNFVKLPLCKNFSLIPNFFHFKKKPALMIYNKRYFSKFRKLNCCSDEIAKILLELPEAFVHDGKRPPLFSLAVLQRFGKLDLLKKKPKIEPLQQIDFSEINHEFRFLSLKKKTNNPKNSLQISLGLIKEDNLLDSQVKFPKEKKNISTIRNLRQKSKTNPVLNLKSYKLILSTATFRKLSYFQKVVFSIILTLASYLSIF